MIIRLFFWSLIWLTWFSHSALFAEDQMEMGHFVDGAVTWRLISVVDESSGAVFVEREENGKSKIVAGDSVPFPLSNFGIEGAVAKKLAEIYVDHEIQSTPGGLEALKARVQEYTKLPHDLLEAYSRYMKLSARPFYGTNKRSVEDMLGALDSVEHSSNDEELASNIAKSLEPLRSDIMIRISTKFDEKLASKVLRTAAVHHGQTALAEMNAVYAGRHTEHFLKSVSSAEDLLKRGTVRSLKTALDNNLIGGVVATGVKLVLEQLSKP